MGGGLLQLVAYGAQDAYISGNPQITFFKGLYKRHTNFAMEPFRINPAGQPSWGTKQSAVVGRHADLMYSTYLEIVLPDGNQTYAGDGNRRLGYNLINYVEVEVGGQSIDRQYGEFMYIWSGICLTADQRANVDYMAGKAYGTKPGDCGSQGHQKSPTVLYIPCFFYYARNPGAALPLIALQYHEVKLNLLWNDKCQVGTTAGNPVQFAFYVDYIYLDTEERRRMAQQSHEYLIEQTQYNEDIGVSSYNHRCDLTFNHPVKELIWTVTNPAKPPLANSGSNVPNMPFDYLADTVVFEQFLQINGQDRMSKRYGSYFAATQRFQHHSGSDFKDKSVYSYSFALRPEEHQPSGTCNFSRIDTATLVMQFSGDVNIRQNTDATLDVRVYAINYNILRVMSGMGGLAFSN
jgi:hypothetical protein